MSEPHVTEHPFRPVHPGALAVYCSDGRFTRAVETLLKELGHDAVDTLTLPGGPGLYTYSTASYSERDAVSRATAFLLDKHSIRCLVMVSHEACGYYAARFPRANPAELVRRQMRDLHEAVQSLRERHPGVEIQAYYARLAPGRISFEIVGER